jgi:hypothetical protein
VSEKPSPSNANTNAVWAALLLLALPCWGFGANAQLYPDRAQNVLINIALAPLVAFLVTVAEQVVVAGVTRILGDRIMFMRIGIGPNLRAFRRFDCNFVWQLVPVSGGPAIATARKAGQRFRVALALSAGSVFLVTIFATVLARTDRPGFGEELASGVALDSLLLLATGLTGFLSVMVSLGAIGVPGFSNLTQDRLRSWRSWGLAFEALRHLQNGATVKAADTARQGLADDPGNPHLELFVINERTMKSDETALPIIEDRIATAPDAGIKASYQNQLAWLLYMLGDSSRLAAADEASRAALESHPTIAGFMDTRGHILLWAGRISDAQPMLEAAYEKAERSSTRAYSAAGLAIIAAHQNRPDDARMWLQRAKDGDAPHALLAKAIAVVDPLHRI